MYQVPDLIATKKVILSTVHDFHLLGIRILASLASAGHSHSGLFSVRWAALFRTRHFSPWGCGPVSDKAFLALGVRPCLGQGIAH